MNQNPHPTARPWGLSRMEPFPPTEPLRYDRVEVDPTTQTGRYLDPTGTPLEAGDHGTNKSQASPYQTAVGGDGNGPQGTRTDTNHDWVAD